MHSQNDEIGVLEVLEIKIFFAAQRNHVEKTLKILSMDYKIQ